MADIDQLHKALINADAAGDTEAATALAAEIKRVSPLQAKADAWSKGNTDVIGSLLAIPKGLYKGFTDITGGATQAIAHGAAKVFPSLSDSVKDYDQVLTNRDNSFKAQSADNPVISNVSRLAGNLISTLPVTSLRAVQGAGMVPNAVNGVLQGGVIGGAQPVTQGDYATQKTKQVGIGAGAGGIGSVVGSLLSRVVRPNTSPEVQTLLDSGVTPTPGQIMGGILGSTEEKLSSLPILGDAIKYGQRNAVEDFNRAAYARALGPIAEKVGGDVGRGGVADVSNKLSAAYQQLLPKLSFTADQQFGGELQKITSMAQQLPPAQADQFNRIIRDQLVGKMTPQGGMAGETLKGVESELSRIARGYKGDPSYDNRQLGNAVDSVLASIRGGLQRSNPQHADELAAINEGYANYARIRDAASRVGSKDGVFTPAQLQAAVRAGDKSSGKGNFAMGNALMQDLSDAGVNVLGSKYPDSGSIGRALLAGGTLGSAAINPVLPAGLVAASVPYAPGVRELAAALLARRPDIASPVAGAIRAGSPALGAGLAPFLVGSDR